MLQKILVRYYIMVARFVQKETGVQVTVPQQITDVFYRLEGILLHVFEIFWYFHRKGLQIGKVLANESTEQRPTGVRGPPQSFDRTITLIHELICQH